MVRRILIGLGLLGLMAGAASAADIYKGMKDERGQDTPFFSDRAEDFNGPYIAVGVGYTSSTVGLEFDEGRLGDAGTTGIGVTGRVGYDKRFGSVVVGLFGEVDYTARDFNDHDIDGIDLSYSGGARLGVVFNRSLLYVNGGYTFTPLDSDCFDDLSGPFVGGGIETALSGGWNVAVEARHTWLGADAIDGGSVELKSEDWTGRLLLSRHF